jgi:hypothetical protein
MAPNAHSTSKHTTWLSLYSEKSRGAFGALSQLEDEPLNTFDDLTKSITSSPDELQLYIAGNALNFLILPGGAKNVRLLHHAFVMAPQPGKIPLMIGLYGNRKGSTVFKELSPSRVSEPMTPNMPMGQPSEPEAPSTPETPPETPAQRMLPTIGELMKAKTELAFTELKGTSATPIQVLEEWPNLFVLHPTFFAVLDGSKNLLAATAATWIIQLLNEGDPDDDEQSHLDDEDDEPSPRALQAYHLLIFLWAVTQGLNRPVILSDPPDTDILDEKQREIQSELEGSPMQHPEPTTPTQTTGEDGTPSALTAALISNLTAVSRVQLDSVGKEDRKKSMLSRFSPEAAQLFTLLSASNWADASPTLNQFATKLLADKDPTKALNLIHSATRNWRGCVCEKGLIQFFSSGYMATDIHLKPSGFSIFMFHPDKTSSGRSTKITQQAIQAMFGDTKIDDESVKYYASQDFFLAHDLTSFESQLDTCISFLEMMTRPKGIATEGYRHLRTLIREEYRTFSNLFLGDSQFGARLGYLADRVFQRFANKLVTYDHEPKPILAASPHLKGRQQEYFEDSLRGLEVGVIPHIPLPASLAQKKPSSTSASSVGAARSTSSGSTITTRGSGSTTRPSPSDKPPVKVVPNDQPFKEWGLPPGKHHGDFFNPGKLSLRPNTLSWPKFPHHDTRLLSPFCLKFQTVGKCREGCPYSHLHAMDDMDRATRDSITSRLQGIYKG